MEEQNLTSHNDLDTTIQPVDDGSIEMLVKRWEVAAEEKERRRRTPKPSRTEQVRDEISAVNSRIDAVLEKLEELRQLIVAGRQE